MPSTLGSFNRAAGVSGGGRGAAQVEPTRGSLRSLDSGPSGQNCSLHLPGSNLSTTPEQRCASASAARHSGARLHSPATQLKSGPVAEDGDLVRHCCRIAAVATFLLASNHFAITLRYAGRAAYRRSDRRDPLRLGDARASGSAKAALAGLRRFLIYAKSPILAPFLRRHVWGAERPHRFGPSRPLAATYRAVGGHNLQAAGVATALLTRLRRFCLSVHSGQVRQVRASMLALTTVW